MTRSRVKSALLALLVLLSLVLSDLLWNGIWENNGEVGLGDASPGALAAHPAYSEVTAPCQLLFFLAKPDRYAVALPATAPYGQWLQRLQEVQISGLHVSPEGPPEPVDAAAEFDFGAELDRSALEQWLPGLRAYGFGVRGRRIRLWCSPGAALASLTVEAQGVRYSANTNLPAARLRSWVQKVPGLGQWEPLPGVAVGAASTASLVPARGLLVNREEWATVLPPRTSLVHSFFVNPSVLTTIRQTAQTYVWTDGSRLVWWNNADGRLTYEDPNVPASGPPRQGNPLTAVLFIEDHGGGPANLRAYQPETDWSTFEEGLWRFRPSVDGLPVVDGSQDYVVQIQGGQVVEFRRPLREFARRLSVTRVRVLGAAALRARLSALLPSTPVRSLQVQLGYAVAEQAGEQVALEPVYAVQEDGLNVLLLDAVTGRPLREAGSP
ncbi:MAG: hypothetical protein IRZ33_01155 [Alicyclobacillaceae bacterium]|nr:hypothetical protein [Alicyclobacillaceae bacterium]